MSNKTYTFCKLLKDYTVIIPKIQRDYAQGRKGYEYLREMMLKSINESLMGERSLGMDFVYGIEKVVKNNNKEYKVFYPLDGQQRLTTLWLVHWYVFFMAYKESGEFRGFRKNLEKFRYETRESSKDFCKCMCTKENLDDLMAATDIGSGIADAIRTRTWFLSEWLTDPTIEAMLRTISGDNNSRKECIESIIVADSNGRPGWKVYRDILMGKKAITFELQTFGNDEMPESIADLMYIKMNDRGKALTDFENLKADLLKELKEQEKTDQITPYPKKGSLYYATQIDTVWTDIFWDEIKKSENKDVAPLMFSFINRYVLNEICFSEKKKNEYWAPDTFRKSLKDVGDDEEEIRAHFDKVYGARLRGKNADDSRIVYEGFEYYKNYLDLNSMAEIDKIFFGLDTCYEDIKKIWGDINTRFSFLPQFGSENDDSNNEDEPGEVKLVHTEMEERLYFYTTCRYICNQIDSNDKGEWYWKRDFSREEYRHWMRVVHNLVRNYYFNDISDMVTCIRLLRKYLTDEIDDRDIYELLNEQISSETDKTLPDSDNVAEPDPGNSESGNFNDNGEESESKEEKNKKVKRFIEQYNEECEKARLIRNAAECEKASWEKAIEEAEEYGFFDGTIRFLYRNGSGEPEWDNIEYFRAKFEKAQTLFPANKQKDVNDYTIQSFLRCFSKIEDIEGGLVFTRAGYDNRNPCWKTGILCNTDYSEQVDMLLSGNTVENRDPSYDVFIDKIFRENKYKYRIFHESARGKYWITEIKPGRATLERKDARGDNKRAITINY